MIIVNSTDVGLILLKIIFAHKRDIDIANMYVTQIINF